MRRAGDGGERTALVERDLRGNAALEGDLSNALAGWLEGLARAELSLPGHVVAEVVVERCPAGVRIDALTLEA